MNKSFPPFLFWQFPLPSEADHLVYWTVTDCRCEYERATPFCIESRALVCSLINITLIYANPSV